MALRIRAGTGFLVLVGIGLASSPGIRPRSLASDYSAHESGTGFTLGAAAIARNEVKKIFAADLNGGGYIVIEVGLFPSQGNEVDLSPADFMLLTGAKKVATRPVDPDAVAASIRRKYEPQPGKSSGIYTTTGVDIGRISGMDPATGRQTHGTVVATEQSVGVGTPAQQYPSPSAPNQGAMEQELWLKGLPDGKTRVPVAGYLYFPKPAGNKDGDWELLLDGVAGRLQLALKNPEKR